jgi:hypothetical protein
MSEDAWKRVSSVKVTTSAAVNHRELKLPVTIPRTSDVSVGD